MRLYMKIKLVTLVIIVVLLIGGGVGTYLLLKDKDLGLVKTTKSDNAINMENKSEEIAKLEKEKAELDKKVEDLEKQVEELKKGAEVSNNNTLTNETQNNTNTNSSIETITTNDLKIIASNQNEECDYIRITSISKKSDNSYLIEADVYNAIRISQTQYNQMVKDKKIVLNNIEYPYYKSDDEDGLSQDFGYGYIVSKDYVDSQVYEVEFGVFKIGNEYVFLHEIGGVSRVIDNKVKTINITLTGNTWVNCFPTGESYTLNECYTNENLLDRIRNLDNNFVTLGYSEENNAPIIGIDMR